MQAASALRRALRTAEATENLAENIPENIIKVDTKAAVIADTSLHAGMSELVVAAPFFRIAEHLVCFGGFLELLFSRFVTRILIWMIFNREFPVSLLNLVFIGTAADIQNLVIVAFLRH